MSIPEVDVTPPTDDEADDGGGRLHAWVDAGINLNSGWSVDTTIHIPTENDEPSADEVADALYRCALAAAYAHGADVVFALQQRMQVGGSS